MFLAPVLNGFNNLLFLSTVPCTNPSREDANLPAFFQPTFNSLDHWPDRLPNMAMSFPAGVFCNRPIEIDANPTLRTHITFLR